MTYFEVKAIDIGSWALGDAIYLPDAEGVAVVTAISDDWRTLSVISGETYEEWGRPFLRTWRTETSYCDCSSCDGHVEHIALPREEWHWEPSRRYVVDMGSITLLEDEPTKLLSVLGMKYAEPVVWMTDELRPLNEEGES